MLGARHGATGDRGAAGRNRSQRNQRKPGLAGTQVINHLVIKRQVHRQPQYRAERTAAGGHRIGRDRAAHQRQRQEGLFRVSGMPDESEGERDRRTDHRRDGRRQPEIAVAAPGQHQHENHSRRHQQHAAKPVDLAPAVEHRDLAHLRQQQRQRSKSERHVDPEDHRPVQMFGEHAADHRPGDTRRHPYTAEIGLVLPALARRHHVRNHRLYDRHDAAAAEPLQAPRQNQHWHVRRYRAQNRARDEQAQRRDDHGAAAIDVGQRAEHRRDCGGGQKVGRDHPRQAGDVLELPADGRQRGGDDGLVERGQKHRQHQADQDGANFARDGLGQYLLVGRLTALPFELVHADVCLIGRRREAAQNRYACNVSGKPKLRQRVTRMGASREGVIAIA